MRIVLVQLGIARYLFDTQVIEAFNPGYWHGRLITVMREVPAAISLLFLAAGVIAMAVAFLRTGLGFSLRKVDMAAMAMVFVFFRCFCTCGTTCQRSRGCKHWVPRDAQLASHIFFCVTAAGAVVLLRLSNQMGGGQLAAAMIWIIVHIGTRAALVLVGPFEAHLAFVPHLKFIALIYDCAPWMFTMAAACRYRLTACAAEQIAVWGVDWMSALRNPL